MVDVVLVLAARRPVGLLVAFALVTGLPLAAARAGCVCDHGHQHGAVAAAAHTCTAACTAATCPMHRGAGARASQSNPSPGRDAMRCSCSGEAQALIGQASVAGVLPAVLAIDAPVFAAAPRPSLVEAPLGLAASPPAPPPRA